MNWTSKSNIYKLIGLLFTVVLSFLSIAPYEMIRKHEGYNDSLDPFRIFAPAVLFSFFLIILYWKKAGVRRLSIYFVILLIVYFINFALGASSYGIAVPLSGAIGAYFIKLFFINKGKFFNPIWNESQKEKDNFIMYGFLTGIIGLIFFYALTQKFNFGIGYGVIIALWQLFIGVEFIYQQREK